MSEGITRVFRFSLAGLGLAVPLFCGSLSGPAIARENAAAITDVSSARRGGGGHAGGARAHAGARPHGNANFRSRNTNITRNNVNVRKNVNVNVNRRTNVVARPVRGWAPRPYYGTIIGGIALGTVIAATTVGVAPSPPAANMCWFWSDAARSQGYWDYCTAP